MIQHIEDSLYTDNIYCIFIWNMQYGRQEWVCMIQIFNMCQYWLNSLVLLTITDMVLIYRASRTAYIYNIYYIFLPANAVQCKNLKFTLRRITPSLASCFSISQRRLAHSPVQISLCRFWTATAKVKTGWNLGQYIIFAGYMLRRLSQALNICLCFIGLIGAEKRLSSENDVPVEYQFSFSQLFFL